MFSFLCIRKVSYISWSWRSGLMGCSQEHTPFCSPDLYASGMHPMWAMCVLLLWWGVTTLGMPVSMAGPWTDWLPDPASCIGCQCWWVGPDSDMNDCINWGVPVLVPATLSMFYFLAAHFRYNILTWGIYFILLSTPSPRIFHTYRIFPINSCLLINWYAILENPRRGGAWLAAVYGVTQSQTWLKWLSSSSIKSCSFSH